MISLSKQRPLLIWLAFAGCLATGLGVLLWFSFEMLRLDRAARVAQEVATREEAVRLALWRMDSALAGLHGLEAGRPPGDYDAFHPVQGAFSGALEPLPDATVWAPSPLLGYTPPFIRLHFRIDPSGRISSPQAPPARFRAAAQSAGVPQARLAAADAALAQLTARVSAGTLLMLARRDAGVLEDAGPAADEFDRDKARERTESAATTDAVEAAPPSAGLMAEAEPAPVASRQVAEQKQKSAVEERQRQELYRTQNRLNTSAFNLASRGAESADSLTKPQSSSVASFRAAEVSSASAAPAAPPNEPQAMRRQVDAAASPGAVARSDGRSEVAQVEKVEEPVTSDRSNLPESSLRAVWAGNELFFVRASRPGAAWSVEGAWLDWGEIEAWLLGRVRDLLPEARLIPADGGQRIGDGGTRRLAFLPVVLVPGSFGPDAGAAPALSPLRISLGAAWFSAVLGAGALALLLQGTLKLSERRGAFVSAVTHELRTPLTTFRMYTEMLSGGMVSSDEQRRAYLDTLRRESERLAHLVDNVLSYSRIERGSASSRVEQTSPARLLARIEPRLHERLDQGGLALHIEIAPDVAELELSIDTTAVEQVLFNLVDNATKYARPTQRELDCVVSLGVARLRTGWLSFRVSDTGPGLPAGALRRLFQPFSKSAHEAAESQPGVGLGLALCRRLAREELGGDLVLEQNGPGGATFRLDLPSH